MMRHYWVIAADKDSSTVNVITGQSLVTGLVRTPLVINEYSPSQVENKRLAWCVEIYNECLKFYEK